MNEVDQRIANPFLRVVILVGGLFAVAGLSLLVTGQIIPQDPIQAVIFQNALLLLVLGSTIVEPKFTRPADVIVNSLIVIVTLTSAVGDLEGPLWWVFFCYAVLLFIAAATCTAFVERSADDEGGRIIRILYWFATTLGTSRLVFSLIFLFAVLSFFELQSRETIILVGFWGFYMAIWPLRLPQLFQSFYARLNKPTSRLAGTILRTDSPGLIRVQLDPLVDWKGSEKIARLGDGYEWEVFPIYEQQKESGRIGTAMLGARMDKYRALQTQGQLYNTDKDIVGFDTKLAERLGGDSKSTLAGFVVENSRVSNVVFETWPNSGCVEGSLVWARVGETKVYYQIIDGVTSEEPMESSRHGFILAHAVQLGSVNPQSGFTKYPWVPTMNSPIFLISPSAKVADFGFPDTDFRYGLLPRTSIPVSGSITDYWDHHIAVLGTTGSGKTELAFDVIRNAVSNGIKVVCIDLTDQYKGRLADLSPTDISIDSKLADELGQRLFDVETGKFGAPDEKKALKEFSSKLRDDVDRKIKGFLSDTSDSGRVSLITLREISNTKATLHITELYLTCLLHAAKEGKEGGRKVMVVVEEAHTVMPETSTAGLGDFDSKGLVSKISQVALQGRKYGIGLLVIAQRTATVSKTILTQCNTFVVFSVIDETSLGFLSNVFSKDHVKLIPNLRRLNAIAFGMGVRSERPVVFEVPFDAQKADFKNNRAAAFGQDIEEQYISHTSRTDTFCSIKALRKVAQNKDSHLNMFRRDT